MNVPEDIEIESVLRLCILRVSLQKRVENNPDVNQIQFLLYQFARANHIINKMKIIMKGSMVESQWNVRTKEELDLVLSISTVDHAAKRFIARLSLPSISGLVGQLIKMSRLFSKFYSKCRVIPGE